MDNFCGRLVPEPVWTRHYVVGTNSGLANVFVYLAETPPGVMPHVGPTPVLDNVNCEFQPYVLGVQTGQPMAIVNSDPILHNVHATPTNLAGGNVAFNLGLPVRGNRIVKTFAAPEVFVRLKCDVHPWMFAYVGVVDHPWFAVTDREGAFQLPAGIPPGDYTLVAVHRRAGQVRTRITVDPGPRAHPAIEIAVQAHQEIASSTR